MLRYPGCSGWHGASSAGWVNSSYPAFVRGGGGMFSFSWNNWTSNGSCGRGVAVVGTGL